MTVTIYKLSIVGAVLVLLAGCSFNGEEQMPRQVENLQSEGQASVGKPSALEVCRPDPGSPYYYRKAILVAGTTGVIDVARDLPGLANLTATRLQQHLNALERFKVLTAGNASFESMALHTAARVTQLGQQYASQFVIKLELQDLTTHSSGGWLADLFGGETRRNVLIKLYIYDTEYGALFYSQLYQDTVIGDVVGYPGNGTTVTAPWFSTDLGAKIDEMLKSISVQINEQLACVPFSTNITAVEGDNIHINAGYLNGIRPGENLRVYRRSEVLVTDGTQKQDGRGEWIRVNTVFPDHSIASATQNKVGDNGPDVGDVVRAW